MRRDFFRSGDGHIAIEFALAGPVAFAPPSRAHRVLSVKAGQRPGALRLLRGRLEVDTKSPIADASADRAIVSCSRTPGGRLIVVLDANDPVADVPARMARDNWRTGLMA